jgi:hypothetical protein
MQHGHKTENASCHVVILVHDEVRTHAHLMHKMDIYSDVFHHSVDMGWSSMHCRPNPREVKVDE